MRQKDNLQRQLRGVGPHVAPDTPEVAGPGDPARMNQQTGSHMRVNRKRERNQREQRPPECAAGKNRPARDQQQNDRRRQQAATQVVENFPARDCRDAIGSFVPVRVAHDAPQPPGDLPVAARPAMLTHRVGVVVGGIVVEKFDITDQGRARKDRFKEIVAQQSLVRDPIVERFLESVNVIETFTRVAAFAEKILVDVRCCRGIGIDTGVA